jgi:hypothetical protein
MQTVGIVREDVFIFDQLIKIKMNRPKGVPQRPTLCVLYPRRSEAAPGLLLLLVTKEVGLVLCRYKELLVTLLK